jgi:hypothetical protein
MFLPATPLVPDEKDTTSSDFIGPGKEFDFVKSQRSLSKFTNDIIAAFTQGRERVSELQTALANAIPGVTKLGGEIKDVSEIIQSVAVESRRNVVASTEEIEKLFAASKIIGIVPQKLSKDFLDVGIGIAKIPEALEESIEYVRSIGGNAKSVMTDVSANMEKMNRFQFEDGVRGLTRMAAQASMLRFSMDQTFNLADRVLDPKGAIDTAAAFQRLGVAVGSLGNPLQLMNQAITDPSGLQDSLVEVSRQFTYFDDKTKTFKINPQGVLTLRELEKQTQVSAAEMTKMGLAAADLDRRLSSISPSIEIEEDDKQYLANIAKMDKDGKYTVEVIDEKGKAATKNLADITQTEFNKLIDEQRKRPQTLEDIARAQLRVDEISGNNIAAIKAQVVGGALTAPSMMTMNESIRTVVKAATDELAKDSSIQTETVRKQVEGLMEGIGVKVNDILNDTDADLLQNPGQLIKGVFDNIDLGSLGTNLTVGVMGKFSELKTNIVKAIEEEENNSRRMRPSSSEPVVAGGISVGGIGRSESSTTSSVFDRPFTTTTDVRFKNPIVHDVNHNFKNLPPNLTAEQINQIVKQTLKLEVNESAFKNFIVAVTQPGKNGSQSSAVYA